MRPAKWQTQYDLTENIMPVSTRTLLLVLTKIKNNEEVDYKALIPTKTKGSEGKCKMESINSCILKKHKKGGWTDKHCIHCTNMREGIEEPQYM